MKQLTDWFPGRMKPVRYGVYERKASQYANYYSLWDGSQWFALDKQIECAARSPYVSARQNDLPWRGITRPKCKV